MCPFQAKIALLVELSFQSAVFVGRDHGRLGDAHLLCRVSLNPPDSQVADKRDVGKPKATDDMPIVWK